MTGEVNNNATYTQFHAQDDTTFVKKYEGVVDAYAKKDFELQQLLSQDSLDPISLIEAQDLQGEKSLFMSVATSLVKGEKDTDEGVTRNIP
ncbi:MAG: hypothetical protein AAF416_16800 [Pseudomonadota bacterium]